MTVVAFTGHRPDKLGGYGPSQLRDRVRAALADELVRIKPSSAISGMALGVDQWAAEICVDLGVPFVAAVPFVGQESRWPEESQRSYQLLLQKAYHVVVVSPGGYHPWKMQARNEWMVKSCDTLVAVWDGSDGGTANCVRYFEKLQEVGRTPRTLVRIDPRGFA